MKKVSLFFILLLATNTFAHKQRVHQYLTMQGYYLFEKYLNCSIPIMQSHLGSMASSLGSHPWETGLMTTGAFREDEEDVVFGYTDYWDAINDKALISISHFWEADNGDYTENNFRLDLYGSSFNLPPKKNSFDKMMRFKNGGWTSGGRRRWSDARVFCL